VRAFWPIYTRGKNNHYGSVVSGWDPFLRDSPALFEIAENVRKLRKQQGEPPQLAKFAGQIRNDTLPCPNRILVPKELTGDRMVIFQSIYIPRSSLPEGHLHNRLVPIVSHPRFAYAFIVPAKYWPAGFKREWLAGGPLLDAKAIASYHAGFPGVVP
jgi:hypothetical protein